MTDPLTNIDSGKIWRTYAVDYETPDGSFSVYIKALSLEHAELLLCDLKETGVVIGEVVERCN